MPLFERRKLFERERIHAPELCELPFGRNEPLLLGGPIERHRWCIVRCFDVWYSAVERCSV